MILFLSTRGCVVKFIAVAAILSGGLTLGRPGRAAEPQPLVTVEMHNSTGEPLHDVPVTFGQVFKKGDVPRGRQVYCFVDGRFAQVDPKRRYDDDSLRYAVVSAVLEDLPGGTSRTLKLTSGGPRPSPPPRPMMVSELLRTDFDAIVTLAFPDGAVRKASAREMLAQAGDRTQTWLQGDVATEWLLSGPPTDRDGRPDEDLQVQFQVRACAGCRRVRVSVVVESCWNTWAGNIRYDAAVTVGGHEVFSQKAVDHRRLSRWRKVFWWGEGEPGVHVVHDLAYLSAAGALPNYDRTLPAFESALSKQRTLQMEGPRWEIMGQGSLTAYMPTTGGRPEIAPYPTWTVRYLLSMDPQAKALVLANGDLAGSWPIHVRSRATGRIMTLDERPEFWLRGYRSNHDKPEWKPDRHPPGPDQVKLSPDQAHMGSFAYVPYLVTGDYYYLEEACFWANYCLLNAWHEPRRKAEGILNGQIRGDAWSLRNLADAAWIAPDGDPEAKYFDEKIQNNLADRIRRMYGPPEYNKLGFWGIRTVSNARIQNAANPRWMVIAPWEHDYLMWSLHHLVELGYADAARVRDFLLRWRIGTLTHAPDFDPRLAAPYRFVVGEQTDDKTVVFYEDWKRLSQENLRLSQPEFPHRGNDYAYSARGVVVCAVDAGYPQAAEALQWIEARFPDLRGLMVRNPAWAIVPGGKIASKR